MFALDGSSDSFGRIVDSKALVFLGLISGPRQYRIPSFQRAYSWEKEDRETLWLDILTQYEVLEAVWNLPEDEREEALSKKSTHYLGTIVLSGPSSLGVPKSEIIDGQQRITTLLLAVCALRDNWGQKIVTASGAAAAESKRRTLSNTYLINDGQAGAEKYRVLPLSTDEKVFKAIVDYPGSGKIDATTLGLEPGDSPRMLQAYKFFRTEMARKSVPDSNPQLKRFAALFPLVPEIIEQALAHRLAVIAIETKNMDDTNAIFESLNAKGRPLTQLDLLRNYVFMTLGAKADSVLTAEWAPIEKSHLPDRKDMEAFVWADVVSRGTNVLQKRTYRTVQSELRENGGNAAAAEVYVKRLNRRAPVFATILDPTKAATVELRTQLDRLSRAGGKTARPLLLWLFEEEHAGRCTLADVASCVADIEGFIVRRFLCSMPPNNLNSMFGVMLSRLNNEKSYAPPTGTVQERLRAVLLAAPKEWPDDDALEQGILHHDFYGNGDVKQRLHVLRELDLSYGYDLKPGYEESDDSIEHILPRSKPSAWVADLTSLHQDLVDVQERWLHTLGNLTVVAPSDNSRLGNKRFSEKVDIYRTLGYKMTSAVANLGTDVGGDRLWGADDIEARGLELAAKCQSLWPRPETGSLVSTASAPAIENAVSEFDFDAEDVVPFTSSIVEDEDEAEDEVR